MKYILAAWLPTGYDTCVHWALTASAWGYRTSIRRCSKRSTVSIALRKTRTLDQIIRLQPDPLSLFNYAHMPQMFKTQRQIDESQLPAPEVKIAILQQSIDRLPALAADGLLDLSARGIEVLPAGRLLVRRLCMEFDAYIDPSQPGSDRFSRII